MHVQVHDLWHLLFDCRTSVLGELALKAVEFVQVRPAVLPQACHAHSLPWPAVAAALRMLL